LAMIPVPDIVPVSEVVIERGVTGDVVGADPVIGPAVSGPDEVLPATRDPFIADKLLRVDEAAAGGSVVEL
jgi:hypothetical protein